MRPTRTGTRPLLLLALATSWFAPFPAQAANATPAADIDPDEIARTPIARRLWGLGFREEPAGSGSYARRLPLSEGFAVLGLTEGSLVDLPSSSACAWSRESTVEGNPVLWLAELDRKSCAVDPSTPVRVQVLLGYGRPLALTVGMPMARLEAALGPIGAVEARAEPARVLPPASAKAGFAITCAILPDGTGLVAAWKKEGAATTAKKPGTRTLAALFIGAKGKGFDGWRPDGATSLARLPIQGYRAEQQGPCRADGDCRLVRVHTCGEILSCSASCPDTGQLRSIPIRAPAPPTPSCGLQPPCTPQCPTLHLGPLPPGARPPAPPHAACVDSHCVVVP